MAKIDSAIRALQGSKPPPSKKKKASRNSVKISANIKPLAFCEMTKIANRTGMTTTEIVNEAIIVLSYLLEEKGEDRKIYTSDLDAEDVREVVLVGLSALGRNPITASEETQSVS